MQGLSAKRNFFLHRWRRCPDMGEARRMCDWNPFANGKETLPPHHYSTTTTTTTTNDIMNIIYGPRKELINS